MNEHSRGMTQISLAGGWNWKFSHKLL